MTPRWQVLSEVTLPEPSSGSEGCLAWRPDAQYLAVSTEDAESGNRIVRVLTNDLNLHSEGRNENNSGVADLYPVLAWSTDSELVGSVQRVRDCMQVVFFERNGLRHGEFVVSGADPRVCAPSALAWNSTCDLLAVHLDPLAPPQQAAGAEGPDETKSVAHVQLWQRDNYHWACKLRLDEPPSAAGAAPPLGCVRWDTEVAFRLRYMAGATHIRQVDFDLSSSTSGGPCTLATTVQGDRVGLTPLAYMLTPPPSYYVQLRLPSAVTCAAYEPLQDVAHALSMAPELPPRERCAAGAAGRGDALGMDRLLQAAVLPVTGDNRLAMITADGVLRVACSAVVPPRHPLARAGCGVLVPSDAASSAVQACNARGQPQKAVDAAMPVAGVCDVPLGGVEATAAHGTALPATDLGRLCLRQLTWLEAHVPESSGGVFEYVFAAVAAAPAPAVGDWLVQLRLRVGAGQAAQVQATLFPVPLEQETVAAGTVTPGANGTVVRVASAPAGSVGGAAALVHTTDCAVWRWGAGGDGGAWAERPHCVLPEVCTHLLALRPTGAGTGALLALNTLSSRLYLNHVLLCPAATSMALHWMPGKGVVDGSARTAQFLFYTTLGPTPSLACVSEHTLHLLLQAAPTPAAQAAQEEGVTTVLRAAGAVDPPPAPGQGVALPDAPPQVSAEVGAEVAAAGAWDSAAARTVERGALLVAVTPGGTRVVLQMPRGNFEGTHPRVLTLTMVRHLLDSRQYGAAVEVCRRHRIDMALLPAHDEGAFVAWAPVALSQLPPTAHDRWDLLLAALGASQGGVRNKYPPPPGYMQPPASPPSDVDAHVWASALDAELATAPKLPAGEGGAGGLSHATKVCCAVRAAIKSLYPGITSSRPAPLLKTVLTSYARQAPADVGAALAVVQAVMAAEKAGAAPAPPQGQACVLAGWSPPATGALPSSAALKHLALLVTPDELWAAALRTYDLALMQMVAQACGRDPKKTEPFLRRLVALAAQLPAHACYAVAAELRDPGAACRWAAAAAAAAVPSDDLLAQWSAVAAAVSTLVAGGAADAAQQGTELAARDAPVDEWLLRLDTLLPGALPSDAAIARAWRLEGDAAAVEEALTAPFTTLAAWGVKGGFTEDWKGAISAETHPLLHRALLLLTARQQQELAAAALQASGGAAGSASRNAAFPAAALRALQTAADIALGVQPPAAGMLLELAGTAPMLPPAAGGTEQLPLVLRVHGACADLVQAVPSLVQSEAEHEEAKEGAGGFADAWGAGDDDDFAAEDEDASSGAAVEGGGMGGVVPPLPVVQRQLLAALSGEFAARSAQYNDSAVLHGLMPPANAPQGGGVSHPVLHRPQAHAALLTAGRLTAGAGAAQHVATLCGLGADGLQQLQPRLAALAASQAQLPEVPLAVGVAPTPPLLAAVAAAGSAADALLGVLVPVLQAACSAWNKAWEQRLEGLPRHLAALAAVRHLRASVPLADLIGVSGASAAAPAAGGVGGDGGSVWDDGASVWSDASSVAGSVWSSASGASLASAASRSSARSAVTDASELLSVGSAASTRTAGTSRTDGLFSHTPSREFTSITFDRGSGGFDKAAEAKKAHRAAAKRARKAGGRGRSDRGRTGSDRNQRSKESAVLDALPDARWRLDTAELQAALAAAAAACKTLDVPAAAAAAGALSQLHASVQSTQAANLAAVAALQGPVARVPVPGVTRDSERLAHRGDVGGHCPSSEPSLACFGEDAVRSALQASAAAAGVPLSPSALQAPHAEDVDTALEGLGIRVQPLPAAHELAGVEAGAGVGGT